MMETADLREPVEGQYAVTRNGTLVGPMSWDDKLPGWRDAIRTPGRYWHGNGSWRAMTPDDMDIIAIVSLSSVEALIARMVSP